MRHTPVVLTERCECLARNGPKPLAVDGRRKMLAVVQHETPAGKVPVEDSESDLRRVRLEGELRLGCEHSPEGKAIAAADQIAVRVPNLERVGVAGLKRLGVG